MSNGKGSGRRPAAVDDAKVASEWDRIFNKPPSRFELGDLDPLEERGPAFDLRPLE